MTVPVSRRIISQIDSNDSYADLKRQLYYRPFTLNIVPLPPKYSHKLPYEPNAINGTSTSYHYTNEILNRFLVLFKDDFSQQVISNRDGLYLDDQISNAEYIRIASEIDANIAISRLSIVAYAVAYLLYATEGKHVAANAQEQFYDIVYEHNPYGVNIWEEVFVGVAKLYEQALSGEFSYQHFLNVINDTKHLDVRGVMNEDLFSFHNIYQFIPYVYQEITGKELDDTNPIISAFMHDLVKKLEYVYLDQEPKPRFVGSITSQLTYAPGTEILTTASTLFGRQGIDGIALSKVTVGKDHLPYSAHVPVIKSQKDHQDSLYNLDRIKNINSINNLNGLDDLNRMITDQDHLSTDHDNTLLNDNLQMSLEAHLPKSVTTVTKTIDQDQQYFPFYMAQTSGQSNVDLDLDQAIIAEEQEHQNLLNQILQEQASVQASATNSSVNKSEESKDQALTLNSNLIAMTKTVASSLESEDIDYSNLPLFMRPKVVETTEIEELCAVDAHPLTTRLANQALHQDQLATEQEHAQKLLRSLSEHGILVPDQPVINSTVSENFSSNPLATTANLSISSAKEQNTANTAVASFSVVESVITGSMLFQQANALDQGSQECTTLASSEVKPELTVDDNVQSVLQTVLHTVRDDPTSVVVGNYDSTGSRDHTNNITSTVELVKVANTTNSYHTATITSNGYDLNGNSDTINLGSDYNSKVNATLDPELASISNQTIVLNPLSHNFTPQISLDYISFNVISSADLVSNFSNSLVNSIRVPDLLSQQQVYTYNLNTEATTTAFSSFTEDQAYHDLNATTTLPTLATLYTALDDSSERDDSSESPVTINTNNDIVIDSITINISTISTTEKDTTADIRVDNSSSNYLSDNLASKVLVTDTTIVNTLGTNATETTEDKSEDKVKSEAFNTSVNYDNLAYLSEESLELPEFIYKEVLGSDVNKFETNIETNIDTIVDDNIDKVDANVGVYSTKPELDHIHQTIQAITQNTYQDDNYQVKTLESYFEENVGTDKAEIFSYDNVVSMAKVDVDQSNSDNNTDIHHTNNELEVVINHIDTVATTISPQSTTDVIDTIEEVVNTTEEVVDITKQITPTTKEVTAIIEEVLADFPSSELINDLTAIEDPSILTYIQTNNDINEVNDLSYNTEVWSVNDLSDETEVDSSNLDISNNDFSLNTEALSIEKTEQIEQTLDTVDLESKNCIDQQVLDSTVQANGTNCINHVTNTDHSVTTIDSLPVTSYSVVTKSEQLHATGDISYSDNMMHIPLASEVVYTNHTITLTSEDEDEGDIVIETIVRTPTVEKVINIPKVIPNAIPSPNFVKFGLEQRQEHQHTDTSYTDHTSLEQKILNSISQQNLKRVESGSGVGINLPPVNKSKVIQPPSLGKLDPRTVGNTDHEHVGVIPSLKTNYTHSMPLQGLAQVKTELDLVTQPTTIVAPAKISNDVSHIVTVPKVSHSTKVSVAQSESLSSSLSSSDQLPRDQTINDQTSQKQTIASNPLLVNDLASVGSKLDQMEPMVFGKVQYNDIYVDNDFAVHTGSVQTQDSIYYQPKGFALDQQTIEAEIPAVVNVNDLKDEPVDLCFSMNSMLDDLDDDLDASLELTKPNDL